MIKKILLVAVTVGATSIGFAPIASAGGAAGAVGVHLNNRGQATNVGAAGAIGDGTSLAGVALRTSPVKLKTTRYYRGRPYHSSESVDCGCKDQVTHAFALNTDGDVNIAAINGIASGAKVTRSKLKGKQVGHGRVHINADIDVDVDIDAQAGLAPH